MLRGFSAHGVVLVQMSQDVLEHLSGVLRRSVVLNMLPRTKSDIVDLPSLSATGGTPPAGQGHGCTVGKSLIGATGKSAII